MKVASASPAMPFKIAAATILDDGFSVEIPVVRPSLIIESARDSINGLGLERTNIHVQADGIASAEGLQVSIKSTLGEVFPSEITLDAQGRGSAELRSASTGASTIGVSGLPFESAMTIVEFGKPWSILIAALLGAIAGWIVRMERRRRRTPWSALVALASAAVVVAAYSVGLRLAHWAPDATVGEALTFFVAAVGAYIGVRVIIPGGARPG